MWRQLTQHFFGREPQDEGQILDDSTARVQLPDTPGQQQTPLQSDIELQIHDEWNHVRTTIKSFCMIKKKKKSSVY